MSDDVAIRVVGVSKSFKLPHEKSGSIKNALLSWRKRKRGYETQQVLKDVSFEIKKGEFFGIVGRNGSGKSTLLKLISQIYTPDKGHIQVNGKLTPFIELGVGFNPELSGRDNVYLNGALLGFNRQEMDAMYDEIVAFAELERFMDQKLKNYSSGMQVRLAFSIAIRAKSDILVLDEVLAVGDAAFQKKCTNYFEQLKRDGQTIVLVTHDMGVVRRYCNRALLIEYGVVKAFGLPDDVANQYILDNIDAERQSAENDRKRLGRHIKKLEIVPRSPQARENKDNFVFDVIYELNNEVTVDLGISVVFDGISLIEHNTQALKLGRKPGVEYRVTYELPLKHFKSGRYNVNVAIFEKKGFVLAGFNSGSCSFVVGGSDKPQGGLLAVKGEWTVY